MESQAKKKKAAARILDEEKFYPVHLTNEELELIIHSLLKITEAANKHRLKVLVRKDKGGKGIDIKIQSAWENPDHMGKNTQYSLGINTDWEEVDVFYHWIVSPEPRRIRNKKYYFPEYEVKKIPSFYIPELDAIYQCRLKTNYKPYSNNIFYKDEWVCAYQANNFLAEE